MLNTASVSYWERKTYFENIDYLIIGAGIVGYSTALHLKKAHPNAKILIIERGFLPSGASSKNAGFACFGSATELYDDLQHIEEDVVWETVALRWKGLQYLKSIIGDDLKLETNGSWDLITENEVDLYHKTKEILPVLNEKIEQITGEPNVYSEDTDVATKFGFKHVKTSFFNRLEGQIDTASMNSAFHQKAIASGILVLFNTEAQAIKDLNDGAIVHTNQGDFSAKAIAICTNGFASQFIPNEDIQPARAQVLITSPIDNLPIKGTFHYQQGYYYFRNIDGRLLFGGGRNLDIKGETTTSIETTDMVMNRLNDLLQSVILPDTQYSIEHQWAGIMGVGKSKRPVIKPISKHVYCGVRLGGMGVAIGSIIGKRLSEMIP